MKPFMTNTPVLSAQHICRRFHEGPLDVTVLQNVDLSVNAGETLAIVGSSGSGKSTLLHVLGGLDAPTSGHVSLMGQPLAGLSASALGELRNQHLGFVYQFHHLLPEFSALDNVAMPLWIRRMDRIAASTQAQAMLEAVGLGPRIHHRPAELSGGERQRVAIARALVNDPSIILADEPTGNLDTNTSYEIMILFEEIHKAGNTIILVTHEPDIADHAHRIVRMRDGLIERDYKNENITTAVALK
jgi:lipoprotein releasing system ATP-binding protein